jgi:silicon transporter
MMTDPCTAFKNVYSTGLLLFSIVIIMGLIVNEETELSDTVHPALAFCAIWGGVLWLSMVEGGQGSLVGLAPVNRELYKESHPITFKCTELAHRGDNLDRYLLGRQFMVVLIVFVINLSGGPLKDAELWGFPSIVTDIFLVSGLAMILYTAMIGQLTSQVNAAHCMLDYINNYFALFTLWVAMAIEFSGLLHSSYLVQMLVAKLSGKTIDSMEEPRNVAQNLFFWFRCLMSLAILGFCFAVTLVALFDGQTTMWEGVPEAVSVIVFFVLMSVVGLLEGMQIAFFAVAKLPKSDRGDSKFARLTCDLLFEGEGNNLPGFMIGRQLCVVSCFFIIARVTTLDVADEDENIFGVSDGLQAFFNTGLLGAIITTIVGSISWQLVASAFPMLFLNNPFTYIFLRICLFFEITGICSGAWVLAALQKRLFGYQRDEVYIGTAEERRAKNMGDDTEHLRVGAGHLYKLPGFADNAPPALKKLMAADPAVAQYLNSIHAMENGKSKGTREPVHELELETVQEPESPMNRQTTISASQPNTEVEASFADELL